MSPTPTHTPWRPIVALTLARAFGVPIAAVQGAVALQGAAGVIGGFPAFVIALACWGLGKMIHDPAPTAGPTRGHQTRHFRLIPVQ